MTELALWLGGTAAVDREARRILEMQEQVKVEEDEDGDPLRPRVRVDREP